MNMKPGPWPEKYKDRLEYGKEKFEKYTEQYTRKQNENHGG